MIFVSFMFRDLDIAESIVRRLEDADADCVRANLSRIPDDELCGTIQYYLHVATHSIVVTSPGVPPSPWVAFEAGFALALRHPLFVFGSNDDALPPFLAEWPLLPDLAALDQFIRVYRESFKGLEQKDVRTLEPPFNAADAWAVMFHKSPPHQAPCSLPWLVQPPAHCYHGL